MELGDNAGNDLVIQILRIFERKVLEAVSKVGTPLAHNIVRSNFLGLRIVGGASDDYVVGVGISFDRIQSYKQTT